MRNDARDMIDRVRDFAHKEYGRRPESVGIVSGKSLTTYRKAGTDRLVTAIINTADTDLDDEVVLPSGGRWKDYMDRNKSVFVDHQYDLPSRVATNRHMNGDEASVRATANLLPDDNALAKAVRILLENGGVGTSIGFEALDRSRPTPEEQQRYPRAKSIVRSWNMIEWSFTAMPCNVACQATSFTSADPKSGTTARELLVKSFGAAADTILSSFGLIPTLAQPRRTVIVV